MDRNRERITTPVGQVVSINRITVGDQVIKKIAVIAVVVNKAFILLSHPPKELLAKSSNKP